MVRLHTKLLSIFIGILVIITPCTYPMKNENEQQPPPYSDPPPYQNTHFKKYNTIHIEITDNILATCVVLLLCYGVYRFGVHIYEKNNPQKTSKDAKDDATDEDNSSDDQETTDPSNAIIDQTPV